MTNTKERGWIKVERSITEEWIWTGEERFDNLRAWLDILFNVNYKTTTFTLGEKCIEIEPGCILTSVLKLSKRWHWNRRTVSKFLKLLSSSGMIKYERCGKGILIKVLSETEENVHTSKNVKECDEEHFFCTFDAQESAQESAQEYTQDIAQKCSTTKESNKANKDLEREKGRKEESPSDRQKNKYSDNVLLSVSEYESLVSELGEADACTVIGIVDEYKSRTGKEYNSDYLAIKTWGIKALEERRQGKATRCGAGVQLKKNGFELLKTDETAEEFERLMFEKLTGDKH